MRASRTNDTSLSGWCATARSCGACCKVHISTIAGTAEEPGFDGDGGPAGHARLNRPHHVAIDPEGNMVIGDSENQRIRRVNQTTNHIATLCGTWKQGATRDGIPAREASFSYFGSLVVDYEGNLLIAGWSTTASAVLLPVPLNPGTSRENFRTTSMEFETANVLFPNAYANLLITQSTLSY